MLKLLLGHWHIHRKKPLLLPSEAELFVEGHNDQNPVNRINPLYEATDSDEHNSILSTNNDAKTLDPKKSNATEKNADAVVQDDKPNAAEESISENPSSKTEQCKDLQETVDPPSPVGSEEIISSSANDVRNVNNSAGETETVNEPQSTEHLNESSAETDTLEKSSEEKLETQEQTSSSGEAHDSTKLQDNVEDKAKLEHVSQETPTDNENLGNELSSDNPQETEKSNSSTGVNDHPNSIAEEDSAAHNSVTPSESRKGTLPKTNVPDNTFKKDPVLKNSGTDSNEDSDGARNLKRRAKYFYNWVSIESSVVKEKSPENDLKETSVAMGIGNEMESSRETPSAESKPETTPPSGILKNSLKLRARAIDELIKKFQPDAKESGIGKISNVLRKKQVFSPKAEEIKETAKPASAIKKTSISGKNPEITFPPPPPLDQPTASKGENDQRSKGSAEGESGIVKDAVSSVKATPSSSKSVQASSKPSSSFLFSDKTGETKTVSSSKIEEDAKITSPKKTEMSKTTSSVTHGRFKKNERSAGAKRSFETEENPRSAGAKRSFEAEENSHSAGGSKIVSSQKDEIRERKSSSASKEPKVSKQNALKQSSALDKAENSRTSALKKVSRTDEVKSSDDPVPSKKEAKLSKTPSSGIDKSKFGETVTSEANENQSPTRNSSEWSNVKDKVEKFKVQLNETGDISPKSDSLIGKSQSEDSGITRGDQISSDSQVSEKLREAGDANNQTKESSEPAIDNKSKLNSNVSEPKAKPRHNKERKRLQKHSHHGVTCKHCKRIKHDALKSSALSKGNCDDYYDKVIKDGLPVHRHIRRPDSWASDMSWEEFAERDFLARLRREDHAFDKHKHLNSSFKKRLAKQRRLHRDPFHQKIHHLDEVFSHPDPYKNGLGGRHHRGHRRQSSLSDDGSSLHFDPYYSRTPSVCSCDECWSIPHFTQVNFGRSSVRSRASDWNYNDLCTCHIVPDLLEHRRKVKFAENHTHGPYNKDEREREDTDDDDEEEEEEEDNSGSLGSEGHASSLSDGNSRSQSPPEGANDDAKSSTSSVRKEKTAENGNGPKGDSKVNDQYQPHPWELEEWDRLLRHRLLKKRRRRAMCMGVMALAMVVFIGLVVAIVMVYLRRKML